MISQVPCVNFKFSARWSFHIKKRWPDCKVNVRILRLISTRLGRLGYVMTTCNPLGKIIRIFFSHCNNWFHSMPWFWLHPPTTHFLIIHRVGLHAIHGKSNNGKDNALFMAVEENTASFWIIFWHWQLMRSFITSSCSKRNSEHLWRFHILNYMEWGPRVCP